MYVSRDICGGEGEDARIYVHTYSTACGRKSSYGYPLSLGLLCTKTFFHTLYFVSRVRGRY